MSPGGPPSPPPVDVFISSKREDERHARKVYDLLVGNGLSVFFSRESLPRLGSDEFHKQIDAAIERTRHMVVVTSSAQHATSQWVEYEWRLFLGELLSGRKTGNLITMLVGQMSIAELPISLRNREVTRLDADGLARLVEYTRTALDRVPTIVSAVPRRLGFRLEATFGGPPQTALVRASGSNGVVVTGGIDGALRVYDRRTRSRRALLGSRRYFLARHEAMVTALAISADDRYIASGHLDGAVHVWDLQDEREIGDLSHDMAIGGLVFTTDSRTIISGGRDGSVRSWDVAALGSESPRPRGAGSKPAPVVYMAVLSDPQWLVTGLVNTVAGRHALQVEKESRPDRVFATLNLKAPFRHVDIAANQSVLVATGSDGVVRVYDWRAAADEIAKKQNPRLLPLMAEFKAHTKPIASLALFADGATLATCSAETTKVWDLATRESRLSLGADGGQFVGLVVADEGQTLIAALGDGRVQVFEAV